MDNKIKFDFSLKNLKELPFNQYEQDFTFIVNGQKYQTSRIIADLISPIIRQTHFTDSTIDKFYINTKNHETAPDDYFPDFLKLATFETHEIDKDRIRLYSEYFYILGNNHENIRLQLSILNPISNENAISQLSTILNFKNDDKEIQNSSIYYDDENIEKIISFISNHFYELDLEKIKQLPSTVIFKIISSPEFRVCDEDSLLKFIIDLYLNDQINSQLFEYVLFNNVSEEVLELFISSFSIDDLNNNIWKAVCVRLFPSKNPKNEKIDRYQRIQLNSKNENIKEFKLTSGEEFSGIMNYLNESTNGNIHDNGTVKITSNTFQSENLHPKNLVDYKNDNKNYASNDTENISIQFDFKDRLIQLTNYSIKSSSQGGDRNWAHLRNWVVEVSNDGQNWTEVDRHTNDSTLNGRNITAAFKVKKETDEFYRYVRLRNSGYSWYRYPNNNNYAFWLNCVEFFGKLQEKQK